MDSSSAGTAMQAPPLPLSPPPGVGANPDKAAELARTHSTLVAALHRLRDDASCDCVTPHAGGALALVPGQATAVAIIDVVRTELGDATQWRGRKEGYSYVEWKHFRSILKQIGTLSRGNVLQLKPELIGATLTTEDLAVFPVKQEGASVSRDHTDLSSVTEGILSRAEAAVHAAAPVCWVCQFADCDDHPEEPLLSTGCACCRAGSSGGRAHVSCLAGAAAHQPKLWYECPTCKQEFTGAAMLGALSAPSGGGRRAAERAQQPRGCPLGRRRLRLSAAAVRGAGGRATTEAGK